MKKNMLQKDTYWKEDSSAKEQVQIINARIDMQIYSDFGLTPFKSL